MVSIPNPPTLPGMRSKLFVPGSRPELFSKAMDSEADAISIDLEDAVAPAAKDEARAAIVDTDEQSKQGPRAPKHTYSLADYGLTADQVKDTFAGL